MKSIWPKIVSLINSLCYLLIIFIIVFSIYKTLTNKLDFIQFVDILSKLAIPIVVIAFGEAYKYSFLQISETDKIKLSNLELLNRAIIDLDLLSTRLSENTKINNEVTQQKVDNAIQAYGLASAYFKPDQKEVIENYLNHFEKINTSSGNIKPKTATNRNDFDNVQAEVESLIQEIVNK